MAADDNSNVLLTAITHLEGEEGHTVSKVREQPGRMREQMIFGPAQNGADSRY